MGGTLMGQNKKAMVLNFDLQKTAPGARKVESPAPSIKTKSINSPARQVLKQKEFPRLAEEVPKISPVPETPPTVKLPETSNLESQPVELGVPGKIVAVKEVSSGIAGTVKEESSTSLSMGNASGGKESARAKYLNDNFAYIRNKILRNVSYPDVARRMGWQGKVLLSFIITANGSVREFKVIKSSGFPMLDRSAVETVKETAPFPRPPVEAQLIIPIVYRLE
jgi:protein TonB